MSNSIWRCYRGVVAVLCLTGVGCGPVATISGNNSHDPDGAGLDAAVLDGGVLGDGEAQSDGGAPNDAATADGGLPGCTGVGPAYVHGDLWAFWHNGRVACDPQHKWWWICEQLLGQGNCAPEEQRFNDCWNATGDFPPTSWGSDSTPTPHSANYGVSPPQSLLDLVDTAAQQPYADGTCSSM